MPTNKVDASEMRAGDVFLCRGLGDISDAIVKLEKGCYSHSALCVRDDAGEANKVIHSTMAGVIRQPLSDLSNSKIYEYVDVFRPKECPDPPKLLEDAATELLRREYDIGSLVLLGLILWRQDPRNFPNILKILQPLLVARQKKKQGVRSTQRGFFGELTEAIRELLRKRGKEGAMTCTELVTTSFWEAEPIGGRWALEFNIEDLAWRRLGRLLDIAKPKYPAFFDARDQEEFEELMDVSDQLFYPPLASSLGPGVDASLVQGLLQRVTAGRELPLNMVSPRDLQKSPSLCGLGRLYPA